MPGEPRGLLPKVMAAAISRPREQQPIEEDPGCKPLRNLRSVVDPDLLLLDHFMELRRRLREVDNQVAELRHEVMKLQRAADKRWVGDMEHLLAERQRYEEQLFVKEREQVELETRGEMFVQAMRALGMLQDGEEELKTIGSVTGRGRATFQQPVKSSMVHPNAGSKKTAPVKHVRFSLHNQ
ncbi:uncharacterized protein [Physcomitrium patens]|uniref:uncharacterized protein n=1 Tax=Physcomitrium patens TaxID=3218 RepID=UPI000D17B338|nr:uncharacterized protein LOC112287118 [Physcomitrium patens]|eukprot:XP_024385594.1 uncharacterized protein LOC112287118 [Physcomitrella patens]